MTVLDIMLQDIIHQDTMSWMILVNFMLAMYHLTKLYGRQ